MTKEERHNLILDYLMQHNSVLVSDLANKLNVSSVTIRKDLTELEKEKKLYRNHGRAILINPYINDRNVNEKEKFFVEEKRLIGVCAAKLITAKDSILIASGTTMHYFARQIHPLEHLTVITASLQVSEILSQNPDIDIIQLGGLLRHSSLSVVTKYAEQMLSNFSCSKLYMGVDGIDLDFGITTTDMMEANLNRVMMQTAQKTITEIGEWEFSQIKGHPSLATYYLLHEKLKACIVYDKQPAPDSLVDVFRTLYLPSYPEHPFTREIGTYLQSQQTFVGGKYIDLVLPDTTGTPHRLSELLRGSKIALIDFWSIHCGPCRRTSKAMIPVYEKYKDKGFCIVGISRDGRQQMIRGIRHDGYPWINLIDEYNRNQIFKSYGIDNSAGYTFLVDSCGTVIAAGASAEEMTAIVERYCQ